MKYVGRCHALRGEIALRGRAWEDAERDLTEALGIARTIGYPTLTWQAAHLLARAHASQSRLEEAAVAARLAAETIDAVAARAPEPALARSFLAWRRVSEAREEAERFLRA